MTNKGIFATKDYSEGEVVETSNITLVREIGSTSNIFVVNGMNAIAEGNALLYRHSLDPNLECEYKKLKIYYDENLCIRRDPHRLIFRTKKQITKGEMLTINFKNSGGVMRYE
tara:strand:- start:853 stop:1191 length:339 start_codon:yes stop_codon:yes gene_type:complete